MELSGGVYSELSTLATRVVASTRIPSPSSTYRDRLTIHCNQNKQLHRNSSTWWSSGEEEAAHGMRKEDENEVSALEFWRTQGRASNSRAVARWADILFHMQMLCGSPSQLISNSFVRGKRGRQDNPVSCSLFTRLTLNSSSRQLKESWTLLSYVFGIVSSQQEHVGSTCLEFFLRGFCMFFLFLCLCSLQVLQLPLTVQKHVHVCINKMFLLSNLDSWQVLHYETVYISEQTVCVKQKSMCHMSKVLRFHFELNCDIVESKSKVPCYETGWVYSQKKWIEEDVYSVAECRYVAKINRSGLFI